MYSTFQQKVTIFESLTCILRAQVSFSLFSYIFAYVFFYAPFLFSEYQWRRL